MFWGENYPLALFLRQFPELSLRSADVGVNIIFRSAGLNPRPAPPRLPGELATCPKAALGGAARGCADRRS